jgi:uncharacterized coiled-coil protein SlyX
VAKTETISWRIKPDIRMALEAEARLQGVTLAEMLDRIAKQWLEMRKQQSCADEAQQTRLHAEAAKWCGSISGGDPHGSEKVSETVRTRLRERYGR